MKVDLTKTVLDLEGDTIHDIFFLSRKQQKEVEEKIKALKDSGESTYRHSEIIPALTYERFLITVLKNYLADEENKEDDFLINIIAPRILENPKDFEVKDSYKDLLVRVMSQAKIRMTYIEKDGKVIEKSKGFIAPAVIINVLMFLRIKR